MNKFGFLLCLILAVSFTKQEDIDASYIYDRAAKFMIGFASDESQHLCSNSLTQKKDQVLPIFLNVIDSLKNGADVTVTLIGMAARLSQHQDVLNNCKIISLGLQALGFLQANKIRDVGYVMVEQASQIESLLTQIKNASNIDDKAIIFGRLVKLLTGLNVN